VLSSGKHIAQPVFRTTTARVAGRTIGENVDVSGRTIG
jgi:hypothetical protein